MTERANAVRLIDLPPARGRMTAARRGVRGAAGALGVLPFAVLGHLRGVPGLVVRFRIAWLAARLILGRQRAVRSTRLYDMFCFPMDSTRYFEFDFMWRRLSGAPGASYLDLSSPRMLPLLFIESRPALTATLLNPDASDLEETRALASAAGLEARCRFECDVIDELSIPDNSVDIITSISVVEHIRDDQSAVRRMWRALKPGGRLLLSMPCSARGEEQFISVRTYGFAPLEKDGSVFHQYLYDERALQRIFDVTGPPSAQEVYGERVAGFHRRLYERKWIDAAYPFWKEPWFMTAFARCESIAQLPGEGVVLLEFVK